MGEMIDGVWHRENAVPVRDGSFQRKPSSFRNQIEPGGEFPPAIGRYHLYVSLACPWAHRTLIFRRLKGLEAIIGLSVTHWLMGDDGWNFADGPGVIADPVLGADFMHQLYARADPSFSGRVTVPVLWDRLTNRIVNNESAEIIRIFNRGFDTVGATAGDFAPPDLLPEIDAVNARIYKTLNNGVYRAGFARSQAAYDAAVAPLFATLDWLDARLANQAYVCGDRITEADWRLFTTLVRFDAVYHGHFKCNLRRLIDYPHLWDYARRLYQWPGVAETVDFGHIKRHYYMSHPWVNPSRIVPAGPAQDWSAPTFRA